MLDYAPLTSCLSREGAQCWPARRRLRQRITTPYADIFMPRLECGRRCAEWCANFILISRLYDGARLLAYADYCRPRLIRAFQAHFGDAELYLAFAGSLLFSGAGFTRRRDHRAANTLERAPFCYGGSTCTRSSRKSFGHLFDAGRDADLFDDAPAATIYLVAAGGHEDTDYFGAMPRRMRLSV